MAQAPSLGEILTISGNEAQGFGQGGGDAAILPFSQGLQFLNYAAQAKANADQFRYKQFQDNMDNFYKDFNPDMTGLSPADQKLIGDKYVAVAKDISENIDVIKNPSSNPEVFARLKTGEAELNRLIAASKMHKAFDDKTTEFTKANPEWQDLNKPKLEQSLQTTSDVWTPYTLDMPVSYAPDAVAKVVEPIAQEKYALATAGKGYITEEEGIRYKKQAWDDAWDAVHGSADKSGRTLMSNAKTAWGKLPPEARGNSFEEWFTFTKEALRPQDQVTKKEMKADALVMSREQNALTAAEGAKDRANRIALKKMDLDNGKAKVDVAGVGRLYNEELTGFKTGQFSVQALQNIYGDGSEVTLKAGSKVVDPNNPMNTTEVATETKVPKRQIVGSKIDTNGNLVYEYIDYSAGPAKEKHWWEGKVKTKQVGGYDVVESTPISFNQARTDFYRIIGDDNAGKVADVAEKYRAKYKLNFNPDLDQLSKFFFPNDSDGKSSVVTTSFEIIPNKTQKATYNGQKVYTNDGGKTFFDQNKQQVNVQ